MEYPKVLAVNVNIGDTVRFTLDDGSWLTTTVLNKYDSRDGSGASLTLFDGDYEYAFADYEHVQLVETAK